MAKLTLLLGPVGAGKTTFALGLIKKKPAVFFNLDEWMTVLFRPDRPTENLMEWYHSRSERCKDLILSMTERSLSDGIDVVLEIGLLQKTQREEFFEIASDMWQPIDSYEFESRNFTTL